MENGTKIAFIGPGVMAEAMIAGLINQRVVPSESIVASGPSTARVDELGERHAIRTETDNSSATKDADVVVLAVKPQRLDHVLIDLRGSVKTSALVVSIVAGATIEKISSGLDHQVIVRSMPNTPAAVDEGMTAYCGGTHADADALALADMVLAAVGETIKLSEDLLDAVTAVSGTGPAYVFLLAEALTEAAIREGLPHHAAEKLVVQTLRGAGALLSVSDKSAFRLRAEVTSPGGTTAAAMHMLEDGGFRALLERAVRSAAQRSRELGEAALDRSSQPK